MKEPPVVWEIACADSVVRHPPYANEEDAKFDASLFDMPLDYAALFATPFDSHETRHARCKGCPGGKHNVTRRTGSPGSNPSRLH